MHYLEPMYQQIITLLYQQLNTSYQKVGQWVDEPRHFNIPEQYLNATLEHQVVERFHGWLKDLHIDLHDGWLRLYATLQFGKHYHFELSVDLRLVQMKINHTQILFVFEQISDTQVIKAQFANKFIAWCALNSLSFLQNVLQKDPLGWILSQKGMTLIMSLIKGKKYPFKIVDVKDGLLYLDIMIWLYKNKAIVNALRKIDIAHGATYEQELHIKGNLYLDQILQLSKTLQKDAAPIDIDVSPESA